MTELKPCPFCGSKRVKIDPYHTDAPQHAGTCYSCHWHAPLRALKATAIDEWNRIELLEGNLK